MHTCVTGYADVFMPVWQVACIAAYVTKCMPLWQRQHAEQHMRLPPPPPPFLPPSHMQACLRGLLCTTCGRVQAALEPLSDLPQRSLNGLCYVMQCCACSHWLAGAGGRGSVLSLMAAIFGGSITTLAGSYLFTLEGCAVITNGRVTALPNLVAAMVPRNLAAQRPHTAAANFVRLSAEHLIPCCCLYFWSGPR